MNSDAGKSRLVSKLARDIGLRSGFSPVMAHHVLRHLGRILATAIANKEPIVIEGFGRLERRPLRKVRKIIDPRSHKPGGDAIIGITYERFVSFTPSEALMTRLNSAPAPSLPVEDPAIPDPPTPDLSAIITPHPTHQEDLDAITRWVATRRGDPGTTEIEYAIFRPIKVRRYWSDATIRIAQKTLIHWSRRCPGPIIYTGLGDTNQWAGPFTPDTLRHDLIVYAKDYEARTLARLREEFIGTKVIGYLHGPVVWRQQLWRRLIDYGRQFFDWLETEKIRPPGTNPFNGAVLLPEQTLPRTRPVIAAEWFEEIIHSKALTVLESAVIHLLAHAVRIDEITRILLEHINEDCSVIKILGKGGRYREIYPPPKTRVAISKWLTYRSSVTWPACFCSFRTGNPLSSAQLRTMVYKVAHRVFSTPNQAHIRALIHPHAFRRYFVTSMRAKGVPDLYIMNQSGHSSAALLDIYSRPSPEEVKRALAKAWAGGRT